MGNNLKYVLGLFLAIIVIFSGCTLLSENQYQKGDILQSESATTKDNYAMYVCDYYPETKMYSVGFVVAKGDQWYRLGLIGERDFTKKEIENSSIYKIIHIDEILPIDNSISSIASSGAFSANAESVKTSKTTYSTTYNTVKPTVSLNEPKFMEGDVVRSESSYGSGYYYSYVLGYGKSKKIYYTKPIKYDGFWYYTKEIANIQHNYKKDDFEEGVLVDHLREYPRSKKTS